MAFVVISWIILGAIVGFIASKIVDLRGDEPLIGIAAAVAGGVVGGLLFKMRAAEPYEAWAMGNILAVVVGAAAAVTVFHLIRSCSIDKTQQTVRTSY